MATSLTTPGAGSSAGTGAPSSPAGGAGSGSSSTSMPSSSPSPSPSSSPSSMEDMILGIVSDSSNDDADTDPGAEETGLPDDSGDLSGEGDSNDGTGQGEGEGDDSGEAESQAETDPNAQLDPEAAKFAAEFDEEVGPPTVTGDKGKKIWSWPESRAKTIYAGHQFRQEVAEFAPTVDDARAHFDSHVSLNQMRDQMSSADDNDIDLFLGQWNRINPDAVKRSFGIMLPTLANADPAIYNQVRGYALENLAAEFQADAEAVKAGNPTEYNKLKWASDTLNWLRGRPSRDPRTNSRPASPTDEREADLQLREQALQAEAATREKTERDNFVTSTNASIVKQVDDEIDKSLSTPLKALKDSNPERYAKAVAEVRTELRKKIQAAQSWNTLFKQNYNRALKSRSDPDRTALAQQYVAQARYYLTKVKAGVIRDYSQAFIAQSGQRHERLARSEEHGKDLSVRGAPKNPNVQAKYKAQTTVDGKVDALLGLK